MVSQPKGGSLEGRVIALNFPIVSVYNIILPRERPSGDFASYAHEFEIVAPKRGEIIEEHLNELYGPQLNLASMSTATLLFRYFA